jgi:hypothetical protein
VRAHRARRDLEGKVAVAVVVADHPLLLKAQDVSVNTGRVGHECRAGVLGRNGKASVVLGQIDLA